MFDEDSESPAMKGSRKIYTSNAVWKKFRLVCVLTDKKQGEALDMLCDYYMKHNPPPVRTRFAV